MDHQVFISFSSADKAIAEKIASRLTLNGITCWISSKNIPAGADYQACIVEAIHVAEIVILIFSSSAKSSNEIIKELSLASKKILIPTRIEDVLPEGAFQYQLSNRQFIDLFEDFDSRLDDLTDVIKNALGKVSRPSSDPKIVLADKSDMKNTLNVGTRFSKKKRTIIALAVLISILAFWGNYRYKRYFTISHEVQELVGSMGSTTGRDRLIELYKIKNKLPETLTVLEASVLIADMNEDSADAIIMLQSRIPRLWAFEASVLLGQRQGEVRFKALGSILNAGKIEGTLWSSSYLSILKGMQSYRVSAIEVLLPHLPSGLNDIETAQILVELTGEDRKNGLMTLAKAGKISQAVETLGISLIVSGMNLDANAVLNEIRPYLR
jgi:hypothetical protein